MTMTNAGARNAYFRTGVASAPPAQLLTMLYDRLMLDLHWGATAQSESDWLGASKHLQHAQAIITELAGSLKPELWDGGPALMSLYFYTLAQLRTGNVTNDITLTHECIELFEPLRQAWHAAVDSESVAAVSYAGISAVG